MEHLQQRLDALKQQEANLLMQLDEVRVLVSAYENTLANDAWAMVPAPASPASLAPEVEVVAAEIPA
jgi:hypothetical protein